MTAPRYDLPGGTLFQGDCLDVLQAMPDNSVDAVVTDPPYGLRFMGRRWDYGVIKAPTWAEVMRVCKPGAHLLSLGGARTYHRAVCEIEDAGWEIRDCVMWVYGSGFPKSHSVSKAIDKAAGAERERLLYARSAVVGACYSQDKWTKENKHTVVHPDPITQEARQWDGWGTALKPAHEPIVLARKPFKGTVAANVLEYGTGAINVDGCRVAADENLSGGHHYGLAGIWSKRKISPIKYEHKGRWPANLIHDGSDDVVGLFPETGPADGIRRFGPRTNSALNVYDPIIRSRDWHGISDNGGSAARYSYCAKASPSERNRGLPDGERNSHPTVKPLALIQYFVRLITPPDATVLDPFMGSGTLALAAIAEGRKWIGIEKESEYVELARKRIEGAVDA